MFGSAFPMIQKITQKFLPNILFNLIIKIFPAAKNLKYIKHAEWCEGIHYLKRVDSTLFNILHVSRGISNAPGYFRIFCPPEINLITLKST